MLQIVNKIFFEIMTLPNNLVLICRIYDHNIVFCSLNMIHEVSIFCSNIFFEDLNKNREI